MVSFLMLEGQISLMDSLRTEYGTVPGILAQSAEVLGSFKRSFQFLSASEIFFVSQIMTAPLVKTHTNIAGKASYPGGRARLTSFTK